MPDPAPDPHVTPAYRRLRALLADPRGPLRSGEATDLTMVLDDHRDLRARVAELLAEKEAGAWMS